MVIQGYSDLALRELEHGNLSGKILKKIGKPPDGQRFSSSSFWPSAGVRSRYEGP
jgi:hypothetical protein